MLTPTDFPKHLNDRLLAAAAAVVISAVLLATAIAPASPASACSVILTGVLA